MIPNQAALYEAFEPARVRSLIERLEIHHTPKQGSWLNRAEIELRILVNERGCAEIERNARPGRGKTGFFVACQGMVIFNNQLILNRSCHVTNPSSNRHCAVAAAPENPGHGYPTAL